MKEFLKYIILFMILWFTACGGEQINSNKASSENDIEIITKKSLIDVQEKKFYLNFAMKSNYPKGIEVELSDIVVDLNSCRVSENSLNIIDHTIKFDEPYQTHNITFTANLLKLCIPTGYTITANNHLYYDGTSNVVEYTSEFKPIVIDENITHEDITTIFDYGVMLKTEDNQAKIKLESKKRYQLLFVNLDNNSSVKKERIHSITIRSSDPSKVQLIDPNNYSNDKGRAYKELTFSEDNEIDLYIQTYNKSGVAHFDVNINYTNNRGEIHDLNTTTYLTILSGEPTAFSINSAGVKYNSESKWFEQKFLISASDKYNNVVNISPKINISSMASFAKDKSGKRVLHGKFSNIKGIIIADNENSSATFKVNTSLFSKIDTTNDFLFLFGNVTANEALGKWDIDSYNYTAFTLNLTDSYYGHNHNNLGFAVGHNYYNEICSSESKEWELTIDSTDGIYQLDEEGKTYVTLKFPARMIGKKIALSTNFSGKKQRSGEVHFETLHSFEGILIPEPIKIDSNTSTSITKSFAFEVDTGTEDRFWVRNAKVVCKTKAENVIVTKFQQNKEIKNISDCKNSENGDIAFWTITLKLEDLEKEGTFSFEECQVSSFIDKF